MTRTVIFLSHAEQDIRFAYQWYESQQTGLGRESKSYTNIVIIAGYVSLFTMWNHVKDMMLPIFTFYIALFLTISMVIFVVFEVFKMIESAIYHGKISSILDEFLSEDRLNAYLAAERIYYERQARVWKIALVPTVAFGIAAAALLIFEFITDIYLYYQM